MDISVIVRARDEAGGIGRCLGLLAEQRTGGRRVETILVDSGSRDGTPEIARDHGVQVLTVAAEQFSFGGALNLGAANARGELLVALSADAFPPDREWLARLAEPFADPRVACASGDRWGPDGSPLTAWVEQDVELARASPGWGYSNGAGAFRAELWRRRPFRADLPGCEDLEWARYWLESGYVCVVDPALVADHDHTHDSLPGIYRRARREAEGLALFSHRAGEPAPGLLSEWWSDRRFYRSALRARLSHRRAGRPPAGAGSAGQPLMAPLIAIDGRDAAAEQLRGWGRYARCLIDALRARDLDGLTIKVIEDGGAGPEVVFEQLRLPRLLRRHAASVVHVTNCFLPLRRPCPGVVTIHDLTFEEWPDDYRPVTLRKHQLFVPRAARSAERIICPSEFTRDDLCARYSIDPDRVRVIPEAPALGVREAEAPSQPGAPARYVLAVGDLRRKKNLGSLVVAFAALHREGAVPHRLVLAGVDSGEGPRLRALAGPAPVELTGYLSDRALDQLIRGADLLVNPSLYEGFGLVTLEAMARGVPVLAARAGALPESGGDAAAYFDPADPDSLREALLELLSDSERCEQMARDGREWAGRFSWERTALETAAVYRELV